MHKSFLIIFFFVANNTAAQTLRTSEKKIFKAFQKTIVKNKDGSISTGIGAWYSCNDQDAYYKSDTISLYRDANLAKGLDCCKTVGWTFYEKDKFLETRFQNCKEPTSSSAAKPSDLYNIKITTSNGTTFLTFFNTEGKSHRFEILELIESSVKNSDKLSYELILKRSD